MSKKQKPSTSKQNATLVTPFSAYGIEKKNKSANNKAPDLSEIKVEYDKDFLKKYLNKEEQINNKKHPVAFKGTDEDVELIIGLILHNVPKNEDNKQE